MTQSLPIQLFLGVLLVLPLAWLVEGDGEVSYVVEPFEAYHDRNPNPTLLTEIQYVTAERDALLSKRFANDDVYVGTNSLKLTLHPEQPPVAANPYQVESTAVTGRVWNGFGATHMSFAYKLVAPTSSPLELAWRFVWGDDADCLLCENVTQLELWERNGVSRFQSSLEQWTEITFSIQDNWQGILESDSSGSLSNNQLDIRRLKMWRLEFWLPEDDDTFVVSEDSYLLLDQLRLIGGGEMFAAPLHHATFEDALLFKEFGQNYGKSDINKALNSQTLDGTGRLQFDYAVEQTASWGGGITFSTLLPGRSYLNLSQSFALTWNYTILQAQSPANRIHFRFNLLDVSDCEKDCRGKFSENYYGLNYILDDPEGQEETMLQELDSEIDGAPFRLTGWYGELGNEVLDRTHIKGFVFGFSIDRSGGKGTHGTGSLAISGLQAVSNSSLFIEETDVKSPFVVEEGLELKLYESWAEAGHFRTRDECQEECAEDPTCVYGIFFGRWGKCFLTQALLRQDQIFLNNDGFFDRDIHVFWKKESPDLRGDYCKICQCDESTATIDCRGKNLTVVPQIFSPVTQEADSQAAPNVMNAQENLVAEGWVPRVLDLRENPHLHALFAEALEPIQDSLETLLLPDSMNYLSHRVLAKLPALREVSFETDGETLDDPSSTGANSPLINAISSKADFFADICCARGRRVTLQQDGGEFSFCSLVPDQPGSDAIYQDFVDYPEIGRALETLTPRSVFMYEAADSVEKCAEFCKIQSGCRYFGYDSRHSLSEPRCRHYEDPGEPLLQDDKYSDGPNGTLPGYVSGWIPLTRNEIDQARVLVTTVPGKVDSDPRVLEANKETDYTVRYYLSLGSDPLRGAVWVTPRLGSTTMRDVQVNFSPSRVALYDAQTIVPVDVTISNGGDYDSGGSFAIENEVESCDQAFLTSQGYDTGVNVEVTTTLENSSSFFFAILGIACVVVLLLFCMLIYIAKNRGHQLLKVAQAPFLALDVFCAAVTVGCFFIYFPMADWVCRSQTLISQTPIIIIASTLVARIWRTYTVLRSALMIGHKADEKPPGEWVLELLTDLNDVHKRCRKNRQMSMRFSLRKAVSDWDVARLVAWLSMPQILIQVIGISLFPNDLSEDALDNGLVARQTCEWDGFTWFGLTYNLFMMILAVAVAWIAKDLPSFLNEKDQVFHAGIISIVLMGFLIVGRVMLISPTTEPDLLTGLWLIQSFGTVLSVVFFLVWPKVKRVYSGEAVVMSSLIRDSGTKSSRSSGAGFSKDFSQGLSMASGHSVTHDLSASFPRQPPGGLSSSASSAGAVKKPERPKVIMQRSEPPPRNVELVMLHLQELLQRMGSKLLSGQLNDEADWNQLKKSVMYLKHKLDGIQFAWKRAGDDDEQEQWNDDDSFESICSTANNKGTTVIQDSDSPETASPDGSAYDQLSSFASERSSDCLPESQNEPIALDPMMPTIAEGSKELESSSSLKTDSNASLPKMDGSNELTGSSGLLPPVAEDTESSMNTDSNAPLSKVSGSNELLPAVAETTETTQEELAETLPASDDSSHESDP